MDPTTCVPRPPHNMPQPPAAADPLLPPALLAGDWPGPALRSTYTSWDRRYRQVLRAWGRSARSA